MADVEDLVDLAPYGTPMFEDLEDDDELPSRGRGKEDIVTDDAGRRRFHGAFTGGFSAGFFNTVGSEEGFTPSSFISSRDARAEPTKQSLDKYLDDEDISEFGITPKGIHASVEFSGDSDGFGRKRSFDATKASTSSTLQAESDKLASLIQPIRNTIGIQMLRKMGWRQGQGIGPKVRRKKTKASESQKVYGCALPQDLHDDGDDSDDNPTSSPTDEFLFGPDDIAIVSFKQKMNLHGLGYKTLLEGDKDLAYASTGAPRELSRALHADKKTKSKGIFGQAFGVGAYEEDDEDIYGVSDMSQYDFAIGSTAERSKSNTDPSKEYGELQFTPSTRTKIKYKYFPPPKLAKDFNPVCHLKKSTDGSIRGRESRWSDKSDVGDPPPIKESLAATRPATAVDRRKAENPDSSTQASTSKCVWSGIQHQFKSKFVSVGSEDTSGALLPKVSADDDLVKAVKMKMFGPLTRKQFDWHPAKVLCKRFNVPDPYSSISSRAGPSTSARIKASGSLLSPSTRLHRDEPRPRHRRDDYNDEEIKNMKRSAKQPSPEPDRSSDRRKEEPSSTGRRKEPSSPGRRAEELIVNKRETEKESAPIDLFKTVFASSDESDEGE